MSDNIIEVKNLVKRFGKHTAVDDISFSVKRGEVFAFLGPNGAGKTTTINILTTLLDRTSGEVSVGGYDPAKQSDKVRRIFGIVFQDQSHDEELTAYENMDYHGALYGLAKAERKAKIQQMLEYVNLWDRRSDQLKEFSGGMKRRMEIARGLLHEPKVLFLDEPTLGLDPQTRNFIWDYIDKLREKTKMTVFFTTHYMEEVERCAERIAVIDYGKIVKQGTTKDIITESGKDNLQDAFIDLTGQGIREQEGYDPMIKMRRFKKMNRG